MEIECCAACPGIVRQSDGDAVVTSQAGKVSAAVIAGDCRLSDAIEQHARANRERLPIGTGKVHHGSADLPRAKIHHNAGTIRRNYNLFGGFWLDIERKIGRIDGNPVPLIRIQIGNQCAAGFVGFGSMSMVQRDIDIRPACFDDSKGVIDRMA